MPILSEKGKRQLLQTLQPASIDLSPNPTFGETYDAAYQFVRDEERSISSEFNNQAYFDRRETVSQLKHDGMDLKSYANVYGDFNYDRFAEETGLVKTDREIYDERVEMLRVRREKNQDVMERGSGFAQFLGMGASYMLDPITLSTLPFGGVGATAKSLSVLSRAMVGARNTAGIALASELAIQPLVYSHKQSIESPYGTDDVMRVLGVTTLTAGILGGGVQGIAGYLSKTASKSSQYLEQSAFPQAPYKFKPMTVNGKPVGVPTVKNIEQVKAKILNKEVSKLTATAGDRLTVPERKALKGDLRSLERRLKLDLEKVGKKASKETKALKKTKDKKKVKAVADAEKQALRDKYNPLIERAKQQINKDAEALAAQSQLERIKQGQVPKLQEKVQKELDAWIAKRTTGEERAVYAIETFAENLRLQKGFRAEEIPLKAYEAYATGATKTLDEAATIAIKDIDNALADATDVARRTKLEDIKKQLETTSDLEQTFKDIFKSNIDKDLKIIANNEQMAKEFNARTVRTSELKELPQTPAPTAKTTPLQGQALEDAGNKAQYNREIEAYNTLENKYAIVLDDDGLPQVVNADNIVKQLDDDLDGLESIMRCSRG
tara:strand:+ start:1500 stop:3326 length:1827 start_codon:yes stop_codon:yes gene_type:complete